MKYETNSKKIQEGQIFVAISGNTVDGHNYVNEAVKKGAIEIIAEKDVETSVPIKIVPNTEEYLKERLIEEYSDSLKDLKLIGITGTNGKTTTCYLVYQMLNKLGLKTAYIGTIGYGVEGNLTELSNTTPDILTLYNLLFDAKEKGCKIVVMEVSSHALSFNRIAGLEFEMGAFTNLTEDHLDFYKTMENYLNAKLMFLDSLKPQGKFLVNNDDDYAHFFKEKGQDKIITLGIKEESDMKISNIEMHPNYTSFKLNGNEMSINLISRFNVYNYVMAFTIVKNLGFNEKEITNLSKTIHPPKGRCETYKVKNGFAVVDYAHTPDAVDKVISAYRCLATSKIITIVGCGGDRDPLKRPIMGQIASEKSDYVIFSNDNPRTEDPNKIMKDILKGVKKENYEVVLDRHEAIIKALDKIEENDIVLILGKGHEDYQILGREKIHFDDSEEIHNYCEKLKETF